MRKANLLIKGIHAVTHELLKNLVLAGFGAICVWLGEEEDVVIREEALGAAFLFRADAYAATAHRSSSSENTATTPSEGHRPQPDEAVVGMRKVDVLLEKAGALNPRVKLWHVTTHDVLHYNASVSGEARAVNDTVAATGEAAFLASFDVVMILNEPLAEQVGNTIQLPFHHILSCQSYIDAFERSLPQGREQNVLLVSQSIRVLCLFI